MNFHTIVFGNGHVIQYRQRDADCNRFCFYSCISINILYNELSRKGIDWDDCDGNDFATICRMVANLSKIDPM